MRKTIAIDLDSTLNTLDADWLAAYNETHGTNVIRDDMTDWMVTSWAKSEQAAFEILARPGWFSSLGIQPYAQEIVEWLSQHYEIYIATAYHPNSCVDKTNWIKEHFPMIDDRHIVFINPKYLLNTDYLIDDGPHNIKDFKQQGILIDAPWNQELGDKYPRVDNWLDVKDYFVKELQV